MASAAAPDITPSMARLRGAGMGTVWGAVGGVAAVIGAALLGRQIGPIVGGTIAGAAIGGDAGRIIAVNAAMDAVYQTFSRSEYDCSVTPRLLIATNNPGKLQEFRRLLAATPWQPVSPADLGLRLDVAEIGATFEENVLLKAHAFADASRMLALADDSGIEVVALGGGPGVHSARYGGPGLTDDDRIRLLLRELTGVPREHRQCRYVAVVAIAWPAYDDHTLARAFHGTCDGTVALEPAGSNGFGYDPVFYVPAHGMTMAQLSPAAKDAISHRGVALRKAAAFLQSIETAEATR